METEIEPTKQKSKSYNPFKWAWKGYEKEFHEWSSPKMMILYFATKVIVFPALLLTGIAILSYKDLPENKFEILLTAFGLTATIAGFCGIKFKNKEIDELLYARILFTFASVALLISIAVVFLIDYYSGPDILLKGIAKYFVLILKYYYSILIGSTVFLWLQAFEILNKALWYYLFNIKYYKKINEENGEPATESNLNVK
jgi:hypothetical protein